MLSPAPRLVVEVPDSSQFSQSVQFSSHFSPVQSSHWDPISVQSSHWELGSGYPDFHGTLQVKMPDDWTCPFAPIKRSLHRSDAADCEVATPTPLIGWFSAPAWTFEFSHFQVTHEFPHKRPPRAAHVERVELAGQQVVARGGGGFGLLTTINYFWALPRIH